jgi:D-alanyl-D-alanine carboxypeptidase
VKRLATLAAAFLALAPATAFANAATDRAKRVEAVVATSGLKQGGEVIVSRFDKVYFKGRWGTGIVAARGKWRFASVTKQIVATLVMQEVAAGRIDLDKPVATYLPGFRSPNAAKATVRQLLRHQSGLPNPDDTAPSGAPDAIPAYDTRGYTGSRDPLTGYCAGPVKGPPGGNWEYNNCDYIVAGALLEAVTGQSWRRLVRQRLASPLGMLSTGAFPTPLPVAGGTIGGRPDSDIDLTAFGASAGLYGSASDLWRFDRALMKGRLLPDAQRAEMWDGQPRLGSIALGQWAFTAKLKGCDHPTRIVERRGQIGGVQVRNFILPEWDAVVIAFADRAELDFGEVWQGKGLSYDLLSAGVCG